MPLSSAISIDSIGAATGAFSFNWRNSFAHPSFGFSSDCSSISSSLQAIADSFFSVRALFFCVKASIKSLESLSSHSLQSVCGEASSATETSTVLSTFSFFSSKIFACFKYFSFKGEYVGSPLAL
ncbi:MAG: hypothetical protein ACRC7P_00560, partial [Enterovibrio sp.]